MKRTIMIVVLTAFAVLLVEFLVVEIYFRTHKFSAKEKPSWLERTFAEHARNISTPSDARSLTNPRAVTEGSMKEAREHFAEHCSICHGVDGKGQTTIGLNLISASPRYDPRRDPTEDRWRAILHNFERGPIHRHARLGRHRQP